MSNVEGYQNEIWDTMRSGCYILTDAFDRDGSFDTTKPPLFERWCIFVPYFKIVKIFVEPEICSIVSVDDEAFNEQLSMWFLAIVRWSSVILTSSKYSSMGTLPITYILFQMENKISIKWRSAFSVQHTNKNINSHIIIIFKWRTAIKCRSNTGIAHQWQLTQIWCTHFES